MQYCTKKKEYCDNSHDSRDDQGSRVGITTYRNGQKWLKNDNFKDLGKKFLGRVAGGQGRSGHQKHGYFFLALIHGTYIC